MIKLQFQFCPELIHGFYATDSMATETIPGDLVVGAFGTLKSFEPNQFKSNARSGLLRFE